LQKSIILSNSPFATATATATAAPFFELPYHTNNNNIRIVNVNLIYFQNSALSAPFSI